MCNAFNSFCNTTSSMQMSLVLVKFCDSFLKSNKEDETTMENAVNLLAYIDDKDVFAEQYQKHLARRLLQYKYVEDREQFMLSQLKQQQGAVFTQKMENMFHDLGISRNNNKWTSPTFCVSITVLTTGAWPTYKYVDMILPRDMSQCIESFNTKYVATNKSRRLTWIHSLGKIVLLGTFKTKPIELAMSTPQALCLLLFNDADELTYEDIKGCTKLPDDELTRCLHSLSCSKFKLLKKNPGNKTISCSDTFTYNHMFTDTSRHINVLLPSVDESNVPSPVVDSNRTYQIDAAIIRIMKSRKTLNCQQLIMEVIQHVRRTFNPEPKCIKKRIESLIEREFLERAGPGVFNYLA